MTAGRPSAQPSLRLKPASAGRLRTELTALRFPEANETIVAELVGEADAAGAARPGEFDGSL